ncbi:unnamed protein product [Rotaria magnacalcarata]
MSISNEQDLTMLLLSISIFSLSTIILWFTIEKRSLFSIFVFSGIYLLSGNIFISLSIGVICFCLIVILMNKKKTEDKKIQFQRNS